MIYRRSPRFKAAQDALPDAIQEKIARAFELFKTNPRHPSLQIRKMECHGNLFEGKIDRGHRFTFEYREENGRTVCWFENVGRHEIVDTHRILRK